MSASAKCNLLTFTLLAGIGLSVQAQNLEGSFAAMEVHVNEPAIVEPTAERIAQLRLPDGFTIDTYAENLGNPRMMAVADDGTVYVTRRQQGDVLMLRDTDGDGAADDSMTVARAEHMHGITLHGGRMYLATVQEVMAADILEDGMLGTIDTLTTELPIGGQHPNRTLAVGPDGMLYVTIGSLSNAAEPIDTEETAAILRMGLDGSGKELFAQGLRNTLGFGWHPESGEMWGVDHGIDWLGDDVPPEELNRLEQGAHYGWPYVWGDRQDTPHREAPEGMTFEEFAATTTSPVLTYTAHAAPMQMAFYTGNQFPDEYQGDAFVAMRGSWNRQPPSGYEVVRIRYESGTPISIEPFVTGFISENGNGEYSAIARLAGLAVARDGSLLVSDDMNGVIYRISHGQ